MILNFSGNAGYDQILKQMTYGGRKVREKEERFLRERDTGERVWRCRTSQVVV